MLHDLLHESFEKIKDFSRMALLKIISFLDLNPLSYLILHLWLISYEHVWMNYNGSPQRNHGLRTPLAGFSFSFFQNKDHWRSSMAGFFRWLQLSYNEAFWIILYKKIVIKTINIVTENV